MPKLYCRIVARFKRSRFPMVDYNRRRSERLLLTVPIRVDGVDVSGEKFSENSRTLVINRHGARIQLKQAVASGAILKISNLRANAKADFRVVGPTQARTEQGGEWGVECLGENRSVWGIDFPQIPGSDNMASALLECRQCSTVRLTQMSYVEVDVLSNAGILTKRCEQCACDTVWGYPQSQAGMPAPTYRIDPTVAELMETPRPSDERRVSQRTALRLPLRVRNFYGNVEFPRSENVSKAGLAFTSEIDYQLGESLQVTCPYKPGGENAEVRARVVRRAELQGTGRRVYGVQYERER